MSEKQKIFTETELPQGSESWLRWRDSHLGASEAACLTGDTLFGTPAELWALKTRRAKPVSVNDDMRRGKRLEPFIRKIIEEREGEPAEQICLEHRREEFMSASLDGFSRQNGVFWEIKAPRVYSHVKLAREAWIPPYYQVQMLQQQEVLESHFGKGIRGFFASYCTDEALAEFYGTPAKERWRVANLVVLPFERCPLKQRLLIELGQTFWDFVERDAEPHDFERLREKILGNRWGWSKFPPSRRTRIKGGAAG